MAALDRDFAAYLAMESQRQLEIALGGSYAGDGTDSGQLCFNINNQIDHDIIARALRMEGAISPEVFKNYATLRISDSLEEPAHQISVRWGSIQSSRTGAVDAQIGGNETLNPVTNDSVSITIIDITPDFFNSDPPAAGGITGQALSNLRVFVEYPNVFPSSDLAAAWIYKLERFFSRKLVVEDFPPEPVIGELTASDISVRALRANVSWYLVNCIDFIRRDSAFVGLPLQLSQFYRLVDGQRVDSAIISVSTSLGDPVDVKTVVEP